LSRLLRGLWRASAAISVLTVDAVTAFNQHLHACACEARTKREREREAGIEVEVLE
jgi:hypothetical protein